MTASVGVEPRDSGKEHSSSSRRWFSREAGQRQELPEPLVYALYIGPVVARQHACAAGRKKLRCSEGAGFTVTLAADS